MAQLLKILILGPQTATVLSSGDGNDSLLTSWNGMGVYGGYVYQLTTMVNTLDSDGPAIIKNKVSAGVKAAAVAIDPAFSAIQNNDMIFPDCSKGTGL